MEVAVDERRRKEKPAGVDGPSRFGFDFRFDGGDAAGGDGDVLPFAPVRERRVAEDQVKGHRASPKSAVNPRERRCGRLRRKSGLGSDST